MSNTSSTSTTTSGNTQRSQRELWAAIIVAVIGLPAAFGFARAMADGETRRHEAPVRAMIGNQAFEQLAMGLKTPLHYYGDELSAPDFELQDQQGRPFKLSQLRGKVVVMNFWTITCQPCVEEMPSLVQLAGLAQDMPDLEVISVTSDKKWSDVETLFPPDSRLTVLFDPEKKIMRDKYGSRMFPETWVIDKNGVIRLRVDGPRTWSSPLALDAIRTFM